jgi:hypothetical protein
LLSPPPPPPVRSYALENCKPDLDFFDANVEEGLIERLNNVLAAPFQVSFILFTVTFYANLAHSLTRSP